MRPIKFRAWDKEDTQMRDVLAVNFYHRVLSVEYEGDQFVQDGMNRFILMQSTGVLDKNDVEIFEGDIVNITQYFGGHPYGEIERVIKRSEYNNDLIADSESGDWRTPEVRMTFRSSDDYEVIGNIYQNPELIKNET